MLRNSIVSGAAVLLCFAAPRAVAAPDMRFDNVTFCCSCSYPDRLCQTHFDHLNWVSTNGHYICMGSDAHRAEIVANGNVLGVYHNDLNTNWTIKTATQKADEIHAYVLNNFTNTGAAPTWVVLNEISAGTWPGNQTYRTWVHDVVHRLKNTYNYNVILYSPFPNPGANGTDWQAVSQDCYIAVENYLSGAEIKAQNFSVSWCQSQYQSSKNSYAARGVPATKLFLGEDFQQTLAGTGWGRDGVTADEWDQAIIARSTAARNVQFAGFISFAWGKNNMSATDAEMTRFEDTYAAQELPGAPVPVHVSQFQLD
jgi:hypothetical protein